MTSAESTQGRPEVDEIISHLYTARVDLGWLTDHLEPGTIPYSVARAGHDALEKLLERLNA